MHQDFSAAAKSIGSQGGQPLRTSVNEIVEVPQNWTMRKESMNEVNAPLCGTGYRKRTPQILRVTHFYDLLM